MNRQLQSTTKRIGLKGFLALTIACLLVGLVVFAGNLPFNTTFAQAETETATKLPPDFEQRVTKIIQRSLVSYQLIQGQLHVYGKPYPTLRVSRLQITEGTKRDSIKVALQGSNLTGDTIEAEDNLVRGGETDSFRLSEHGWDLTIKGPALSGPAYAPFPVHIYLNNTGVHVGIESRAELNNMRFYFREDGTASALDLTKLLANGKQLRFMLAYVNGWKAPGRLVAPASALIEDAEPAANAAIRPYEDGLSAYRRGDYAEAEKQFLSAAEQGSALAQDKLGYFYHYGLALNQDYGQAVTWYRKAAGNGIARSQVMLARMHNFGEGLPRDFDEAAKWYRMAAERGHAGAQNMIGSFYFTGKGVARDLVQAYKWFDLAVASTPAYDATRRDEAARNRDRAAAAMSPAQISRAEKLARKWKPK